MPKTDRDQHDIRVSSAILNADLTQAEKMVYIGIRSRQGGNPWCFASQQTLAGDIGTSKSFVNRTIRKLLGRGWLEKKGRKLRCLAAPTGAQQAPNGASQATNVAQQAPDEERKGGAQQATIGAQQATAGAQQAPRTENKQLKPTRKTNKESGSSGDSPGDSPANDPPPAPQRGSPLDLDYDGSDWKHHYAQTAYRSLQEAGVISPQIRRKAKRDPPAVMDDWADELRLLVEQDGYSQDEIFETLQWALSPGSWWMQNSALCSLGALRRNIRSGEKTKFDAMYAQAKTDTSEAYGSEKRQSGQDPKQTPAGTFEHNRQLAHATLGLERGSVESSGDP